MIKKFNQFLENKNSYPYFGSLISDARLLDLFARHFDEKAKKVSSASTIA